MSASANEILTLVLPRRGPLTGTKVAAGNAINREKQPPNIAGFAANFLCAFLTTQPSGPSGLFYQDEDMVALMMHPRLIRAYEVLPMR